MSRAIPSGYGSRWWSACSIFVLHGARLQLQRKTLAQLGSSPLLLLSSLL